MAKRKISLAALAERVDLTSNALCENTTDCYLRDGIAWLVCGAWLCEYRCID